MADQKQLRILKQGFEVWNNWRKDNPDLTGIHIDLSGADLSGAKLFLADLSGANLSGANLNAANLNGAKLNGANLIVANLNGAKLNGAKLNGANLSGACLDQANLKEAELTEIKAFRTNFGSAILTGSYIKDWDINGETNFENVICEYIYFKPHQQERRPSDSNRNFAPGEFTKLVEINFGRRKENYFNRAIRSEEIGKYEAIKINFKSIIQCLEENSNPVSQQTTTKYQIEGTNIFVNSKSKRLVMTQNNPNIKINKSNLASVTGSGKIDTAIANQHNYASEQKQTLAEAAAEIQKLVNQLEESYPTNTTTEQMVVATEVVNHIENKPSLKQKITNAAREAGLATFEKALDSTVGALITGAVRGWLEAET